MLIADLDYLEETTPAVTGGSTGQSNNPNINIETEPNIDAGAVVFNNQQILIGNGSSIENTQLFIA